MRIGKCPAHLLTQATLLCAVGFVHQHNDVVAVVEAVGVALIDLDIFKFKDGSN
ncbi:hypothetical protein D3C72_2031900 [compost metagenome]